MMGHAQRTHGAPTVLVVGGALAGMTAALAARSAGADVSLLSLGPAGRSGNTLVAGGISSATEDAKNSPECFLDDLIRSAQGVEDPALARTLAEESLPALQRLEAFGVRFAREKGTLLRRLPPGHSVPRNIPTDWAGVPFAMRGITFMRPLAERLMADGIAVRNGVRAVRLLRAGDRVAGVLVQERKSGRCFSLRADAVVLATGGYAGLFSRTNNVSDSCGDGVALALSAGCAVRDMEMVQYHPCMMFTPVKLPVLDPLFGAGAVLRNSMGEEFMIHYDAAGNMARRDVMARAIFLEAAAGRGVNGGVYVDCGKVPAALLAGQFAFYSKALAKHGLRLGKDMLVAGPCAHYSLGGVVIDTHGRTTLKGLYAAGEVCGGVHGANRLAGAALMEACVFGWRAGRAAAEDPAVPPTAFAPVSALAELRPEEQQVLERLKRQLRALLWEHVSVVRDEAGLTTALQNIRDLERTAQAMPQGAEPHIFRQRCIVAECITQSAFIRQESRGVHYRRDFPLSSEEFSGHTSCRLRDGKVAVHFQAKHTQTPARGRPERKEDAP